MFILCTKGRLKIYAQDLRRVVTVASTVDKMFLRIGLIVWTMLKTYLVSHYLLCHRI